MSALRTGQTLLHYRLLEKLGEGGMGEVYRAQDLKLERTVAIKLLPVEAQQDATARVRLLREARSASALSHPGIVTVHAIEEASGVHFIVMEYVEGESLRDRLSRGPLSARELLDLGSQVADALEAAHGVGLLHRDIKPANILVTPRGRFRVLDFGLAKRFAPEGPQATTMETLSLGLTGSGVIVGTVSYMSPEQTRGEALDGRSDVFSLGAVLYEAATGRPPFRGPSALSIFHEIATFEPPAPSTLRSDLPGGWDDLLRRALAKERDARFESAAALGAAVDMLRPGELSGAASAASAPRRRALSRRALGVGAILALAAVTGFVVLQRSAALRRAREEIPGIERLVRDGRLGEAHERAARVRSLLGNDPHVQDLWRDVTLSLSVTSEPSAARVTLAPLGSSSSAGNTPLGPLEIPRVDTLVTFEKDGFAPVSRLVSSAFDPGSGPYRREQRVHVELRAAESQPPGMVFVPGGEYRAVGWGASGWAPVRLQPYFVDALEVSCRQYLEFVRAGGYGRRELWKEPIVRDGKPLAWEEAALAFVDRTGLPGPRGWRNGTHAPGEENLPVTGLTWYEASAYAAFRGKRLPTLFEWEKAARDGRITLAQGLQMPWGYAYGGRDLGQRANFSGKGPTAVGSRPYGVSPFGCLDMAGNVSEWCANRRVNGFATAGGSWADIPYEFGRYGDFPGHYSSDRIGFRCAMSLPGDTADQGGGPLSDEVAVPVYTPPPRSDFEARRPHYAYDPTPLQTRVDEVVETEDYRRERVSYVGAREKRAFAYLWLPRNGHPPFQVLHLVPTAAAFYGLSLQQHVDLLLLPFLRDGRAIFAVAIEGYTERLHPPGYVEPDPTSVRYREQLVERVVDHRRGVDMLLTRPDVDAARIAFLGVSQGGTRLLFPALEPRYRCVVLLSAGLRLRRSRVVPEADPVSFAPFITVPKLMVNGRYDEAFALRTEAEPLFRLLTEPKRMVVFEGGHTPTPEQGVPVIKAFLDEVLGAVR